MGIYSPFWKILTIIAFIIAFPVLGILIFLGMVMFIAGGA
jgi:hypothetical protein